MANVFQQDYSIGRGDRNSINGHKSFLILLTGLSGAGKSVIANALEQELNRRSVHTYVLDGDNIRRGICKDLDFSAESREENLRRIGVIANLMIDAGLVTIAAFVSPFQKSREMIRQIVGDENYVEVYISTPLEECEKRDTKGLYAKARAGEISDFTGISSPYEAPENPDLEINTVSMQVEEALSQILLLIEEKLNLHG